LTSIIFALTARIPRDVFRYFLAQFFATIILESGMIFLGTKSPVYAGIYIFFTLLIIASMFGIVADKLKNWMISWAVGVLVAWICFVALPRPLRYYNWISIGEGMTLTTCGCILVYNARKGLYLALGVLWLALAAFRLTYALELNNPSWKHLNSWLPAAACILCFTLIGLTRRRSSASEK
jgi:hypothetical protein